MKTTTVRIRLEIFREDEDDRDDFDVASALFDGYAETLKRARVIGFSVFPIEKRGSWPVPIMAIDEEIEAAELEGEVGAS